MLILTSKERRLFLCRIYCTKTERVDLDVDKFGRVRTSSYSCWSFDSYSHSPSSLYLSNLKFVNLLNKEQALPEFMKLNPSALVPVLEIDNRHLCQSLAILDYLQETRRKELWPSLEQPAQRQLAREVAHIIGYN